MRSSSYDVIILVYIFNLETEGLGWVSNRLQSDFWLREIADASLLLALPADLAFARSGSQMQTSFLRIMGRICKHGLSWEEFTFANSVSLQLLRFWSQLWPMTDLVLLGLTLYCLAFAKYCSHLRTAWIRICNKIVIFATKTGSVAFSYLRRVDRFCDHRNYELCVAIVITG